MYVHGYNVIDINAFSASSLSVAQQSLELEETCGRHKLQNIVCGRIQIVATATVQILHDQL